MDIGLSNMEVVDSDQWFNGVKDLETLSRLKKGDMKKWSQVQTTFLRDFTVKW